MRPYLNSYRYEERTYRLLKDWLEQSFRYELDTMTCESDIVSYIFDTWFPDGVGTYDDIYMEVANRDIANEMLNKYVVPRYYNWAIGWADSEEIEDYQIDKAFVYKLWMILKGTYNKYAPLIRVYKEQEANLMASIKSQGVSRYNDTPQDGGEWADDQHTSNISTSETTTEGGTTAVRLAEIRAMWENLYSDWAAEFKGLFIWVGEVYA